MKFRLLYEGPIAPRQKIGLPDVHAIRKSLHPQLYSLWQFLPLAAEVSKVLLRHEDASDNQIGIIETRGNTLFTPIVTKRLDLMCELDITFLRKQAPGQLIGEGGDIDNRVKTLLDALSVPPFSQQDFFRDKGDLDHPVHCLLQDDSLVTRLSVETDRLLRPTTGEHDLVAIIQVKVTASRLSFANIGIVN